MSSLNYSGITLPYCFVSDVDQRAVYDDADTDVICTEFDINVQATLNWNYLSIISPTLWNGGNPLTQNPADAMNAIRAALLKPRQTLSLKFGGVELIPQITGNTGKTDSQNGPKPKSCRIVQMTDTTFLISYHITARYLENPTIGANGHTTHAQGSDVLSNRWSESVDIDDCNYTTRTRTGKFIIRTDNADGFIADQIRAQMAVVSIPQGFTRSGSQYTVSPDGMAIEYRIVDKEEFKMPPQPAFKASGSYTESLGRQAAMKTVECEVSLKGDKGTSQSKLVETAIAVCAAKVRLNTPMPQKRKGGTLFGGGPPPTSDKRQENVRILEEARCKIGLYENTVDCYIRIMAPVSENRFQNLAFADIDTFTPLSDKVVYTPNYQLRGSASLLLQAAAYYDPTLAQKIGAGNSTYSVNPLRQVGDTSLQMPGTQPGQGGKK